jgi:hypothetical protein
VLETTGQHEAKPENRRPGFQAERNPESREEAIQRVNCEDGAKHEQCKGEHQQRTSKRKFHDLAFLAVRNLATGHDNPNREARQEIYAIAAIVRGIMDANPESAALKKKADFHLITISLTMNASVW